MHNKPGYFGEYGGCFAPETLIAPLQDLSNQYEIIKQSPFFQAVLKRLLKEYVGRPTPIYYAKTLSDTLGGAQIYLKREDLAHTGAHKINNTLGQALLAQLMGKTTLIAETGAGQHGVATATVARLFNMECVIYMGAVDMERQALNVTRMRILGATVHPVYNGAQTLKDATSEAMRHWVTNIKNTYDVLGSALGPHPYPTIVRDFQKVIGTEARRQILEICGKLPDHLIACVGGGSNAIGLFYPFLNDQNIKMTGVEAGGTEIKPGLHAARFATGKLGVLQGTKTVLMQDEDGQIQNTHSISAGLDYPAVGPEHAYLNSLGRAQYSYAHDDEALDAAFKLAKFEGIIPALESAHAIAHAIKIAPQYSKDTILLVGLSGRGDKDVTTFSNHLEKHT